LPLVATQWIPLSLLFAEKALRRKRVRDGALTGLLYGLNVLASWYYAVIGGVLLGGYVVLRLWTLRRDGQWLRLVRPALLFGLAAGMVITPALLVELSAARETQMHYSAADADQSSASPQDYITPNELHPIWGPAAMKSYSDQNVYEVGVYPGVVALLLSAVALLMGIKRRGKKAEGQVGAGFQAAYAWPWAVLAGAMFVLSLGLYLHKAGGETVKVGGSMVPMPGLLLYQWVPGFSSLRVWARFGIVTTLCLSVLAGMGFTRLFARQEWQRWKPLLAGCLVALVLFDDWGAPYGWGLTSTEAPKVANWLAAQPAGAVAVIPMQISGRPLYWSTFYKRPSSYGYDTFVPPGFKAVEPVLAGFPSSEAFKLLKGWGVRYVVVSASNYGASWAATKKIFAGLGEWTLAYQGLQPVFYHGPLWVGDIRPEVLDAMSPDEMLVYELH
ncbi:MAG: hypothetical protein M3014_14585, partial [Chloroflexota bacterium]|nr:hypothetical protein [Chloroflexota bacterium]